MRSAGPGPFLVYSDSIVEFSHNFIINEIIMILFQRFEKI